MNRFPGLFYVVFCIFLALTAIFRFARQPISISPGDGNDNTTAIGSLAGGFVGQT